jgi:hypothetical protein
MSDNTQLTTASGFNTKNMMFSEPQTGSIPNSVPQINYKRINIQIRNDDGTSGDLIFPTSQLFSFGIGENVNQETGKLNGYVMPLCLWNREGPSSEEKEWSDTFDKMVDECKKHLISNREEIDQYDLDENDLKKFNPLYWKKDKGKVVEGTGPTLYAKLLVSKKDNKIVTMYYDSEGQEVDPMTLVGKRCNVKGAVKIESIFIGNKISLQLKLYECEVRLMDTGMKRMMKKRPEVPTQVSVSSSVKPLEDNDIDSDGDASVKDSDDDDDSPPVNKPTSPKKVLKRRVKKVTRKAVENTEE